MVEITAITEVIKYIDGLKAVVFDLDDTLYSEKEYVRSGFQAVASVLPCIVDMENKLWRAFTEKKPAIDEVLKAEGLFSEELKQKCMDIYRSHEPKIKLYNGMEDVLRQMKSLDLKIGIITDGRPEGQRAKIKALCLETYVDHIVVTDEMGGLSFRKPDIRAFQLMRNVLQVEFPAMGYVGDNINKDFGAPEKLHMRSIWFRNKDGLYI